MTIIMHPDKETASQTFMGEDETYQTGMAAIGVPAVRVSVSSFPRIVSAEELRAGGYRLEGNLIRHSPVCPRI